MDQKPAAPGASGREEPAPQAAPAYGAAEAEQGERFGPLLVQRLRKDDGRSLIIYTRAGREA